MTEPERLITQIETGIDNEENSGLRRQIDYLKQQLIECHQEDEKLYRAFMADVFDAKEYAARKRTIKEKVATLEREQKELSSRLVSREQVEADKELILAFASRAREAGITANASFEFKKRMVKLLVDKIILNVNEGWFRIEGAISGAWSIGELGADTV